MIYQQYPPRFVGSMLIPAVIDAALLAACHLTNKSYQNMTNKFIQRNQKSRDKNKLTNHAFNQLESL